MTEPTSKAALVTGCSSGIGRATAERLAGAGWTVYATARKVDSLSDLEAKGCRTLALDVTDEDSMAAGVRTVEEAEGAVGVLVNNAGYSQSGAIETLTAEQIRRQYETNVFGLIRMSQLVLPGMRRQRFGKIVNVSSMGANFTFPGGGLYHSTKYAVEAISEALRFEVKGFGVDVIVLQPGIIRTGFSDTAVSSIGEDSGEADGDPYRRFNRAVAKATAEVYEGGPVARLGGGPETVAAAVEKAITAEKPKARYRVTASAHLLTGQRALMSDGLWDRFLATRFPRPGAKTD